jgi:23S rRNA pseudouridine2605 synthase
MARRRSFSKDQDRSNARSKAHGPRPGGGPHRQTTSPGARRREQPHHLGAAPAPRPNADSGRDIPGKLERVQKILAHAGLGSRRACEALIVQGRVSIDGETVKQLGTRVDPARARIAVDGEPIKLESMVYYAVNKPRGYVSTNFDPSGRPRVVDLLPEIPERVYTVGRLDEDSTGLMILTNDGELANRLAHPRFGVEKLYRALVAGLPSPEMLAKLTEGIWLSDGKVRAKRARIVGRQGEATRLELVLAEGKKREIRRMLSKLGHKVMSLNRIAVGPVSLKGLAAGQCRPLSRYEVDMLRKVAAGVAISVPRTHDRPATRTSDDRKERPAGPPKPKIATTPSPHSRTPASSNRRPMPAQPSRRRIIGLEPEPSSEARPGSASGRGRKRPPPRRRDSPPPVTRKKPSGPLRPPGDNDQ